MPYKLQDGPQSKLQKATIQINRFLILIIVLIFFIVGLGIIWIKLPKNPVPANISNRVDFPIYYPDPKYLPTGFTLDRSSFQYIKDKGVVYAVINASSRLVFSLQDKPTNNELANFVKQYIPINHQVLTLVGTATEGSINNQTVVSLPTNDKTWIILTGPPSIYGTDNLAKILQAIRKP